MTVKKRRGRGKAVSAAERIAIETMAQAGTSQVQIAKALNRSRSMIVNIIQEAKDTLHSSAKFYVEKHLQATQIAAAKGDSKPAEWALERIKVVEPAKAQSDQGFTVQIGVMLPGLGDNVARVLDVGQPGQVIETETLTPEESRLADAEVQTETTATDSADAERTS